MTIQTPTQTHLNTQPNAMSVTEPVEPNQRIQVIDILRGFAIFGILLVNMQFFNQSILTKIMGFYEPATLLDQWADWFIRFFATGKFYSTFSFLFGLGMAIQYARAQDRGARFGRFWMCRMGVLLVFGVIHAYLFWVGDILLLYSLLGMLLLLFRNRRPRTVLIWAAVMLLIPLIIYGALLGLVGMAQASPEAGEMVAATFAEQDAEYRTLAAVADEVYATGSFAEVTAQRAQDMMFMYFAWIFFAPNVFAMFLLGLYAGKRGIFKDLPGHLAFIRKVWWWGLVIGLLGNAIYVYFGESVSRSAPTPELLLSLLGQTFGAPALSLFYISSLILLAQQATWRQRLAPLAAVGRMALTNYLMHTVICTTLFYGYGLGLYGQVGLALGVLLTLVIYTAQIPLSNWWLARFRYGPMEWLWRTLTYGRWQSLRLSETSASR